MNTQETAADPGPADPIFHAAVSCLKAFDNYIHQAGELYESNSPVAELRSRFDQWVAYIGAFAAPRASLDARLAFDTTTKDMVLELLRLLHENLHWSRYGDVIDDGDPDAPGLSAAAAAVERLLIMAVEIRRSARQSHRMRPGSWNEQKESLCSLLRRYHPFAPSSLLSQLAASIHIRGASLQFLQKHNDKLAFDRTSKNEAAMGEVEQPKDVSVPHSEVQIAQQRHEPELQAVFTPAVSTLDTVYTGFSHLNRQRHGATNKNAGGSIIGKGLAVWDDEGGEDLCPPLPKGDKCSICSEPMKSSQMEEHEWKAHVHQDLEPYVCLAEECLEPPLFFVRFEDWLYHMQARHMLNWAQRIHTQRWYCHLCNLDSTEYENKEDLLAHFEKQHAGMLTESQIQGRVRRNMHVKKREIAFTCPLCDGVPKRLLPIVHKEPYLPLAKHIGRHLEDLSFLSLSYVNVEYCGDESVAPSSTKHYDGQGGATDTSREMRVLDDLKDIPETTIDERGVRSIGYRSASGGPPVILSKESSVEPPLLQEAESWDYILKNPPLDELDMRVFHHEVVKKSESITLHGGSRTIDKIARQVRHKFRQLSWLPRNCGRAILDACDVDSLLSEFTSRTQGFTEKETLAFKDFVLNKAPQLCIMLIRFKAIELIGMFFLCDIMDANFPLQATQDDDDPDLVHIKHPERTLEIDDILADLLFCSDKPLQHDFFVPILEWKGFNDPPLMGRLPYLTEPVVISTSHFSIVSKCTIHNQHINIKVNGLKITVDEGDNPLVAIKELLRTTMTPSQFNSLTRYEYNCLSKLRTSKFDTPHLIRAAAFYRRGDSLFFVFPWAPHGNLLEFWRQRLPRVHDQGYVKWLFGQLLGISQTIRALHEPDVNIRHGDLKPENILCFEASKSNNEGEDFPHVFVISDVGLAKEHERLTPLRSQSQPSGGGTLTYTAPEMETHENRATSRRYDIWSLGCIYLEFVVWLLYGIEGLRKFSERRRGKFYRIKDSTDTQRPGVTVMTAELDPAVSRWIEDAMVSSRTASDEDSAISRLLILIRDRLLVIDANPDYIDLGASDYDEADEAVMIPTDRTPQSSISPTFRLDRVPANTSKQKLEERAYAGEVCNCISEIIRQAEHGQIGWTCHKRHTL